MNQQSKIKNALLAVCCIFSVSAFAQEKTIASNELPREITAYIAKHFPSHTITKAEKERDGLSHTYEVELSGNIDLEFNRKKEIKEIDGESRLPNSVIPNKILQYVAQKYPNNYITDWKLDGKKQQAELNNGLELEFNRKGDFLRIDD